MWSAEIKSAVIFNNYIRTKMLVRFLMVLVAFISFGKKTETFPFKDFNSFRYFSISIEKIFFENLN